jgi:transcriptional regulator with XRE-family HTH domain
MFNGAIPNGSAELAAKIARLVEERGWNQEDFARITNLNRQTVRQILRAEGRKLRNVTVQACAKALGLTVSELRALPLERLLPRMHGRPAADGEDAILRLLEQATQPELRHWIERNPDRARDLGDAEFDELLSLQGDGGPIARYGVEQFIVRIERRRRLVQQVKAVADSDYLELLEQLVGLLHEKVRPRG